MFSEFELEQKEKAFNYCKEHFIHMDAFLNRKFEKFRDIRTNYTTIFITLARFITYKEDIWIKDKRRKTISTNFSKSILDDFLFKGKLTSTKIAFESDRKQMQYDFTPIQISNILQGKENDSSWIIDNVRDSITHGHYYIDFTNNNIIIKNEHADRILECSMKFDLFLGLNELITEERIGGYTEKPLTTFPFIYTLFDKDKPVICPCKNEQELRKELSTNYIVSYTKISNYSETDSDKKFKDLSKFYNFNTRLKEKIYRNLQGKNTITDYYVNSISSYIENNMEGCDVLIFSNNLTDEEINQVVNIINEDPKYYERSLEDQGLILQEVIRSIVSGEKITLERGVVDLVELYIHSSLKPNLTDEKKLYELHNLIFGNVNSFKENKKLANLFVLGINNFVSNKESIYDKYFDDYNEFDLSNFNYQDYSGYNRLVSKLAVLNDDLKNLNNGLSKAEYNKIKLENNLAKAPDSKKNIISNNITNLEKLICELKNKINELIIQINDILTKMNYAKNDDNGNYIDNNNKNFFTHLRNSLAHNHIRYANDRVVYNRKIILEDYDDNGNLSFKCECRYYDLAKLFNNELFLEAMKSDEKILTKKN